MNALGFIFAAACLGIFTLLTLAPVLLEQPHGKRAKKHTAQSHDGADA